MIRSLVIASLLSFVSLPTLAGDCSSVDPRAKMGPAPDINNWSWSNACYIEWPGGYINGMNARLTYEPQCKAMPGFLAFIGDYGSNRNACVFSAPQNSPKNVTTEPRTSPNNVTSGRMTQNLWPDDVLNNNRDARSRPDKYVIGLANKLPALLRNSMDLMRSDRWDDTVIAFEKAHEVSSEIASYVQSNAFADPVVEPAVRQKEIISCLLGTSTDISNLYQYYALEFGINNRTEECYKFPHEINVVEIREKYEIAKAITQVSLKRVLSQSNNLTPKARSAYIAAGCVELVKSNVVSSACDFHDDKKMYRNEIRIPPGLVNECPASVKFEYMEIVYNKNSFVPNVRTSSGYASRRSTFVDTCTSPVKSLRGVY